jgi:hypothetical protein
MVTGCSDVKEDDNEDTKTSSLVCTTVKEYDEASVLTKLNYNIDDGKLVSGKIEIIMEIYDEDEIDAAYESMNEFFGTMFTDIDGINANVQIKEKKVEIEVNYNTSEIAHEKEKLEDIGFFNDGVIVIDQSITRNELKIQFVENGFNCK